MAVVGCWHSRQTLVAVHLEIFALEGAMTEVLSCPRCWRMI